MISTNNMAPMLPGYEKTHEFSLFANELRRTVTMIVPLEISQQAGAQPSTTDGFNARL